MQPSCLGLTLAPPRSLRQDSYGCEQATWFDGDRGVSYVYSSAMGMRGDLGGGGERKSSVRLSTVSWEGSRVPWCWLEALGSCYGYSNTRDREDAPVVSV